MATKWRYRLPDSLTLRCPTCSEPLDIDALCTDCHAPDWHSPGSSQADENDSLEAAETDGRRHGPNFLHVNRYRKD